MEVPPPPLRVRLSIVRLPREPFFIYGGKETMTTYHQDIMTNFSSVHDRSTVYPFFRVVFQNMHKRTCPCQQSKVFTLKINFTTILFKSSTKFSVILIMHKKHSFCNCYQAQISRQIIQLKNVS